MRPEYLEALGTPFLAGRDFQFQDQAHARVTIINHLMARYYFGDASPVGRRITLDGDEKPYEVVGVVGDAKYLDIRETPARTMYFNTFQERWLPSQFALRTRVDPAAVTGEVRRAVREIMKSVPVARVITLADQVDASIVPERLIATLSGLFGALGSLLAAIGLSGLLAYTVAQRTNEIGIRMALGATRGAMSRMVLLDALQMSFWGLMMRDANRILGQAVCDESDPGSAAGQRIPHRLWRPDNDCDHAAGGLRSGASGSAGWTPWKRCGVRKLRSVKSVDARARQLMSAASLLSYVKTLFRRGRMEDDLSVKRCALQRIR